MRKNLLYGYDFNLKKNYLMVKFKVFWVRVLSFKEGLYGLMCWILEKSIFYRCEI